MRCHDDYGHLSIYISARIPNFVLPGICRGRLCPADSFLLLSYSLNIYEYKNVEDYFLGLKKGGIRIVLVPTIRLYDYAPMGTSEERVELNSPLRVVVVVLGST